MFILGVLAGPALAILVGDFVFKPGEIAARWVILGVAASMLVIAIVPFFTIELKAGLLIGFPLGLLLAGTPMALRPIERSDESAAPA
jgi:hypothetical protein